jgi:hypothetical protein
MGAPFVLAISALCSLLKRPPNMEASTRCFNKVSNLTG